MLPSYLLIAIPGDQARGVHVYLFELLILLALVVVAEHFEQPLLPLKLSHFDGQLVRPLRDFSSDGILIQAGAWFRVLGNLLIFF